MRFPTIKAFGLVLALPLLVLIGTSNQSGSAPASTAAKKPRSSQMQKQKNTMGDMKTIGVVLEAYYADEKHYPEGNSIADAMKKLSPDYLLKPMTQDAWGHELHYLAWKQDEKAVGPDHYMLVSGGRDEKFEHENLRDYKNADTQSFDSDIALGDGQFIQQPVGRQK
jgi:hypothetical protein